MGGLETQVHAESPCTHGAHGDAREIGPVPSYLHDPYTHKVKGSLDDKTVGAPLSSCAIVARDHARLWLPVWWYLVVGAAPEWKQGSREGEAPANP